MNTIKTLTATLPFILYAMSSQVLGQVEDYRAPLTPVNIAVNGDTVDGYARLQRDGDELHIRVEVQGIAPEMMHMQHLHGSEEGMDALCSPADLETQEDDVVDLLDTRPYSGVTLIPLHDNPASLLIEKDTYPVSNRAGSYTYEQTVDWPTLEQAMADKYGIEEIELGKMVVYIHGIPGDTQLPESVRSLPGAPAHATLPVACGKFDVQAIEK